MANVYDEMGNLIYSDYTDQELDEMANAPAAPQASASDVGYVRGKIEEFQRVLDALAVTGSDLQEAGAIAYASGDPQMIAEYEQLHSDYENKRSAFVNVARAIQIGSDGINALGINFPSVQVPFGLGIVPAVALAGAAAAVALAIPLMTWASGFWRAVSDFAARWQHMNAIQMLPEAERPMALEQLRQIELKARQAEETANSSPIAALANVAKWAAIAGVAFVVWKAIQEGRK